jgi:hypothetical protein
MRWRIYPSLLSRALDEHHGMHLMEHLGVDDRDLVMYCIEKEMEQSEVAFLLCGFFSCYAYGL